jgi:hypothetical protein
VNLIAITRPKPERERIPTEEDNASNQKCAFHDTRATAHALSEQAHEKSEGEFERRLRYRNSSVSTGGWSDELNLRWSKVWSVSTDFFAAMHDFSRRFQQQ